jgi:hypothetical protein
MPEDQWLEFTASDNETRYNHALAAAILILTYHLDPAVPESDRCDRIVSEILNSMNGAEAELARARYEPSEN